jgi:hypothetical protein
MNIYRKILAIKIMIMKIDRILDIRKVCSARVGIYCNIRGQINCVSIKVVINRN